METLAQEKLMKIPRDRLISEAEFLDLCDEDLHAEFVDGRIIVHSPASIKHGDINAFLVKLVGLFVDKHELGRVWSDHVQVRLRAGLRQVPDLVFVANESKATIRQHEIDGAPDLVVEIVSPESVERDWREKAKSANLG